MTDTERMVDPSTGEILEVEDVTEHGDLIPLEATELARKAMELITVELAEQAGGVRNLSPDMLKFLADLRDEVTLNARGQLGIVNRLLAAETLEEVLAPAVEPTSGRDLIGQPFEALGVHFRPSDVEGNPAPYAVFDAVHPFTNERTVITVGGWNVITQAWKIRQLGGFPCRIMIEQGRQTDPRKTPPNWLRPA